MIGESVLVVLAKFRVGSGPGEPVGRVSEAVRVGLRSTGYALRAAGHGVRATGYGTTGHGLRAAGYGLRVPRAGVRV